MINSNPIFRMVLYMAILMVGVVLGGAIVFFRNRKKDSAGK